MERSQPLPRPKTQRKRVRHRVRAHHLHWIRGLIMAHRRDAVPVTEVARLIGISPRIYQMILSGERFGGAKTIKGILALREQGIMVHLSDFEEEVPIQESPQTSEPSPHHR